MAQLPPPPPNMIRAKLFEAFLFILGRHSGSFFLKIGAGFFCVGKEAIIIVLWTMVLY